MPAIRNKTKNILSPPSSFVPDVITRTNHPIAFEITFESYSITKVFCNGTYY